MHDPSCMTVMDRLTQAIVVSIDHARPARVKTAGVRRARRRYFRTQGATECCAGALRGTLARNRERLCFVRLVLAEKSLERVLQIAAPIRLLEDMPVVEGIRRGALALQIGEP